MKRIFHIARNELQSLFFSPIAWLLMVIFMVITGLDYLTVLEGAAGNFERGGPYLQFVNNLTDAIIVNSPRGYFPLIIKNLYLFFPLVTMGLISREINNGTIRLLYSSPVRVTEVVLGKFMAMVMFTLAFLLLTAFTLVGLCYSLVRPDLLHMAASMCALFLLFMTYAAIGLFISSLTSYQIVAAIITFTVFAFFSQVGDLWQDIDFVRNITYYLNLGEKSRNLVQGLLNLRDITYFLLITAVFLSFTVIKLRSGMQSVSWMVKAARYLSVSVFALLIGYITSRPQINVYADMTRDQLHTITPPTQAMLQKLNDGPLEITVYANLFWDLGRFQPKEQNSIITTVWEPYIRFKPDIKINFVYYYDTDTNSYLYKVHPDKTLAEIAEKEARTHRLSPNRFLSPDSISKQVDVEAEGFRSFFKLTYHGKSTHLRVFDDLMFWPSENEIAAAVNRLIGDPPRLAFLTDEIERGPLSMRTRDYRNFYSLLGNRSALLNQGYDSDTISIKNGRDIPGDIAALVIADPRTPFAPESLAKIGKYIAGGGNLFMATEPDRADVVRPILDSLGLSLRNGLLLQPGEQYASDLVFAYMTEPAKNISPQFQEYVRNNIKYFGDTLFRIALPGASALEYREKNGFRIAPLLVTDPGLSWNRLAPVSNDSLQTKVARRQDDESGSFTTAAYMKRQLGTKEQRIIVVTDADFLTEAHLMGWNPARHNFSFGFWSFSQFTYGKFPANTMRPQTDDALTVKVADLDTQRLILVYLLPGLIALAGSVILIRRKRK